MKELELKQNVTKEEARRASSLGLVYQCPVCKIGNKLTHEGRDTVKCNGCEGVFKKP